MSHCYFELILPYILLGSLPPTTKCGKVIFSVMVARLSTGGWGGVGSLHVTTICNVIGQSQVTWHPTPNPHLFKLVHLGPCLPPSQPPALSLPLPLDLFKLVHYVSYRSISKRAVSLQLKGLSCCNELLPTTKDGNVFRSVCLFTGGGGQKPPSRHTPPSSRQTPL